MELVLVEYELYAECYYLVIMHVEDFTYSFVYAIKRLTVFKTFKE